MGDKKFKAGKDNLTTGIFQWSKDYTSGASNFSEAGILLTIQSSYTSQLKNTTKLYLHLMSWLSVTKSYLSKWFLK